MHVTPIEKAIAALQQGKMILLVDDYDRENEADLVMAAEHTTVESMCFMMHHGCGIICLSMTAAHAQQLNLKLLVGSEANTNQYQTPFAMSFEARTGVSTGISAQDRVTTILTASKKNASANDIVTPGHVFPLIAQEHGVLARRGHTEGSVDLLKIANLKPQAVICELMNEDGSVAKGQQVKSFAQQHQLAIVSIQDIVNFRLQQEDFIEEHTTTTLPLEKYGTFKLSVIKEKIQHTDHVVLEKEPLDPNAPCLVRIHSSCLTGDIFHSLRCDCHEQLHYSLARISQQGGILIYLDQEGRGIGLFNKIKAYALQEKNLDTVQANEALGFSADLRKYYLAANILRNKGINHIRLLTNNPQKMAPFNADPYFSITRVPMPIFSNPLNHQYLLTKKQKLNHQIDLGSHHENSYRQC